MWNKGDEVPIEVEQPWPWAFATEKVKTSASIGTYFPPRTTLGAQPTLKSVMKNKQVIQKCDLAIAKWFLDAFVPFNAANSTYFQHMVDALCSMIQDTRLQVYTNFVVICYIVGLMKWRNLWRNIFLFGRKQVAFLWLMGGLIGKGELLSIFGLLS